MRRTLAGLLFGLAYACASLSIAGFLLQRSAFDPGNSADAADVILGDSELRTELIDFISDSVVTQLNGLVDPATIRANVTAVAGLPEGQKLLAGIIHDAHAHMIGDQKGPVKITGAQLVGIVRDERAAALPTLILPVPEVTALVIANHTLDWLLPIALIGTLAFAFLGFTAHPERSALLHSLALGLLLLALLALILGYLVPKFLVPALSDSVWTHIPARLADDSLPLLIGLELMLVGSALALLAGTGMMRRRRRWSTPVNTYRYSEERRWS
ncbi:MAG TPA: hypothetical protein PK020_08405 [Ilumatobacteraceae bacterium]|nr:hypothetical protein [Ilumatobacteraceae bacterium]HRB05077.1 hypothetical protein [Ilumatobacteraceae bacterium]